MGEDHRPGPAPLSSVPRAARAPELWVVIEVPEPVRSAVLAVRRIVSRTSRKSRWASGRSVRSRHRTSARSGEC